MLLWRLSRNTPILAAYILLNQHNSNCCSVLIMDCAFSANLKNLLRVKPLHGAGYFFCLGGLELAEKGLRTPVRLLI